MFVLTTSQACGGAFLFGFDMGVRLSAFNRRMDGSGFDADKFQVIGGVLTMEPFQRFARYFFLTAAFSDNGEQGVRALRRVGT